MPDRTHGTDAGPIEVSFAVDGASRVSGLWDRPARAEATFVFAHGAGADMHHRFMADFAARLAHEHIATLRYQFPYTQRGSRRPDPPAQCHATVRAAVSEAARRDPSLPIVAGGKSFGGRMTSQAQALDALPGVRALAFVGFPLHPAKRPSDSRGAHLADVSVPMLFLQGTRDALADAELLRAVVTRLGSRATLHFVEHADHAFHVPARSGRDDAEVLVELARTLAEWIRATLPCAPSR